MIKRYLGFIILLLGIFACHKETLSDRARASMMGVVRDAVEGRYKVGVKWMQIRDVKTIYENDSICLLQCRVDAQDSMGKKEMLEYHYVYLWDRFMSYAERRAVFNDAIIDAHCLSDERIERFRRELNEDGGSLYDGIFGETAPIKEKREER